MTQKEQERHLPKSLRQKIKGLEKLAARQTSKIKELLTAEKRLKMLFEQSPDAYYITDVKGFIIDSNHLAAELFGFNRGKLIGKNFLKLKVFSVGQRKNMPVHLARLVKSKQTGPAEYTIQNKDGTKKTIEVRTRPVKIGSERLWLNIARDISGKKQHEDESSQQRNRLEELTKARTVELSSANAELLHKIRAHKETEEALHESEEKLRDFIETSGYLVFRLKKSGCIEYVSPRVTELYGYSVQELVGKYIDYTTPREEISKVLNAIRTVYEGHTPKTFQIEQITKLGARVPMEINVVPIYQQGQIVGLQGIMRDITDRKRAEKILMDSEERYRDLVEKTDIAILLIDAQGKFKYFNNRFAGIFGYTAEEMRPQAFAILIHPDDRNFVLTYQQRHLEGNKIPSRYTFRGVRKDSTTIHLEADVTTVMEDDKVIGAQIYMWDVSEQVLAQEALKKSENRFRELNNTMRDGLILLDLNDTILEYNPAFRNIVGFRADSLVGKSIRDLTPPRWHEAEAKIIRVQLLQNGYTDIYEKEFIGAAGNIIPVEVQMYLIKDHNGVYAGQWAIVRDITNKKQIEREINMLAQAVKSVQECVTITDLQDVILFVNDAFCKTYGYLYEEVVGKPIDFIRPTQNSQVQTEKILPTTLKEGWQGELHNKRKDGTLFPIFLSTAVVYDERKNPMAIVGVASEITEHKKAEEQLRQGQKMEAIGQLAGGIAHDFNNILTAINGYAELALLKMESKNPLFKEITGILKAGKKAGALVRQLLAFGRKQLIELKILNINTLIKDLDKMLRRLIGEDIKVEMHLQKNIGLIKADPSQIEQVLVNLVVNARDAINQKTELASAKKITIATSSLYLDEAFLARHPGSLKGEHISISISDTGVGIDPAIKDRIFEPFFTTKDRIKGTGLGLSTVYGIVKQNNGSIYVQSEMGNGTTFKIYWPSVAQDVQVEQVVVETKTVLQKGSESILFVEDNDEVRQFTLGALHQLGYTVYEASNGEKALDLLRDRHPQMDLLISDVIMPEMGGKELADKVRAIWPATKILFTSGYTDNHIVHSGKLQAGVNFIHKPYSIESLSAKIREVLDT